MNAERLYAVAQSVQEELNTANSLGKLQTVVNTLQAMLNQPNQSYQHNLANQLLEVYKALTDAPSDSFSPSWKQILREIGGEDVLGNNLKLTIEGVFARNQITYALALTDVKNLFQKLQEFKTGIDQAVQAFKNLRVGKEDLKPGECEIGILIPRAAIENKFSDFHKELKEFDFILSTFSEIVSGKKEDFKIHTLSSSELLIHLGTLPRTAACIALAIERLIEGYKKLLEIKKLRRELQTQGVPAENTKELDAYVNSMMEKSIDELGSEIMKMYHKNPDKERRNELSTALKICLNKIANRIDRGYNIEVRAALPETPTKAKEESDDSDGVRESMEKIQKATKTMQFINQEDRSILTLPEEEKKKSK